MTPAEAFDREHERNIRGIESAQRHLRAYKPRIKLAMSAMFQGQKQCSFMISWPLHDTTTMFYLSIADAMKVIDIADSMKLKPLPAHDLFVKTVREGGRGESPEPLSDAQSVSANESVGSSRRSR